jgi:cysteine desulfurase
MNYFDNNSTTELDPKVFQAMLEDLKGPPANPSSVHQYGVRAKKLLQSARKKTAQFFSAKENEIIFTSGGTESINLMLRGLPKGHIITTNIEHSATYKTLQVLETKGYPVTYISCGLFGAPTPEQIEEAISPHTKAIVLSLSNSETGVKIDLESIASLAKKKSIPLLLDGVSYIGKEPLTLVDGISALAISAHKFHGPKGIGALYCHHSLKLTPTSTGGVQEELHRAGTENLSGALGLAKALEILQQDQTKITNHLLDLRSHFECELLRTLPDIAINGEGPRVSNTVNIAFLDLDGESLLMRLDMAGIAASLGSACSSGALEPSRVLLNMGIDRKTARSSLRFSFGRTNTREEVDQALEKIIPIVKKLRTILLPLERPKMQTNLKPH